MEINQHIALFSPTARSGVLLHGSTLRPPPLPGEVPFLALVLLQIPFFALGSYCSKCVKLLKRFKCQQIALLGENR